MEWISVKDLLPDKNKSVLVWGNSRYQNDYDLIYVAWINDFGVNNAPIWQYSYCCGCYCNEEITHWMPLHLLPLPKKGD